jgi:hypothetical protein
MSGIDHHRIKGVAGVCGHGGAASQEKGSTEKKDERVTNLQLHSLTYSESYAGQMPGAESGKTDRIRRKLLVFFVPSSDG